MKEELLSELLESVREGGQLLQGVLLRGVNRHPEVDLETAAGAADGSTGGARQARRAAPR